MKTNVIERGWVPILKGRIYCSPRCGHQCTKTDHDKAVKQSQALADRLGKGWTPRVWENCGWHWDVSKGPCADDKFDGGGGVIVRLRRSGEYDAEFRSALTGARTVTQFFAEASTPEDAIGAVRQDARTFISRLEADLASSL